MCSNSSNVLCWNNFIERRTQMKYEYKYSAFGKSRSKKTEKKVPSKTPYKALMYLAELAERKRSE